jgi:hypothetical protein
VKGQGIDLVSSDAAAALFFDAVVPATEGSIAVKKGARKGGRLCKSRLSHVDIIQNSNYKRKDKGGQHVLPNQHSYISSSSRP